jgi:hypothetical protein
VTSSVTGSFYAHGGGWKCPAPPDREAELATPKRTEVQREGGCFVSNAICRESTVLNE